MMRFGPRGAANVMALAGALVLCAPAARAQIVNVLTPRVESPDEGFAIGVEESFGFKRGNTNRLDFGADLNLRYVTGDHQLLLLGSSELALVDDEFNTDKHFGHLRYIWRFYGPLSMFAFAQAETDRFRDISVRIVGGLGLEVTIAATEHLRVAVATTLMPNYETLRGGSQGRPEYLTRLSSYLTIAVKLAPWITFSSTTFHQPALEHARWYRVLSENAVYVDITEHFGLKLTFDVAHDSHPPPGVHSTDIVLGQGMTLTF